ncbi:MAG: hypothetical protein RL030_130 [Pseudomonadota bacterium]|jgi:hypothetical protein
MLRKITVLAVVLVGVVLWAQRGQLPPQAVLEAGSGYPDPAKASQRSFSQRDDGKMVVVSGQVDRTLSDDRDGSKHQRFIVRIPSGQTLLVAHNIDLAPRLDGLTRGESVTLHGQFEWNERGGVIHWTHRDPQGVHPGGYIERQGRRYE